jgi:hypothetical protein
VRRGANRISMLLRNRPPAIDSSAVQLRAGFEHLEPKPIAVLRWLNANKIDFVVVGPVGHAIRGDQTARGAVAIVPAPYARNYDRLARALTAAHAGLRSERGLPGSSARTETVTVELSGEKLARGRRWMLRFSDYDLDVERSAQREGGEAAPGADAADEVHSGRAAGARYQELLYEATRFDLADEVSVQVASPEDLELYSHVRRTGIAPEFRIRRNPSAEDGEGAEPQGSGEAQADPSDRPAQPGTPGDRADLSSDA